MQTWVKRQQDEIECLQDKIRCYADNQTEKDDEIKRLKIRLEQIETHVNVDIYQYINIYQISISYSH